MLEIKSNQIKSADIIYGVWYSFEIGVLFSEVLVEMSQRYIEHEISKEDDILRNAIEAKKRAALTQNQRNAKNAENAAFAAEEAAEEAAEAAAKEAAEEAERQRRAALTQNQRNSENAAKAAVRFARLAANAERIRRISEKRKQAMAQAPSGGARRKRTLRKHKRTLRKHKRRTNKR